MRIILVCFCALFGFSFSFAASVINYVASGANATNSCAVKNGVLLCWGSNDYGQLGNESYDNAYVPEVIISTGVTQTVTGMLHTCAILSGVLKCWGNNSTGQLGNGTTVDSVLPLSIISAGVTRVALGAYHTCAIVSGALKCWGENTYGQLGDGTTTNRLTPKTIIAKDVIQVSAGASFTCALLKAGNLKCWGRNNLAQLGNDSTTDSLVPTQIISSGVTLIKSGDSHSCALVSGALKCWGLNNHGQIGDGTLGDGSNLQTTPELVYSSGVTTVAMGGFHTCAIRLGTLKCWGRNDLGQIGDGTTGDLENHQLSPKTIIGSGVTQIGLGKGHSCALVNGILKCWGRNNVGQLGDGTTADSLLPITTMSP